MKTEWKKCIIPFSDGSEEYKVGSKVLVLPELETKECYAVGTDYGGVFYIDKRNLE